MLIQQIALIVWAAAFLVIVRQRLYYIAFCVILLLAGGAQAVEFAPTLWLPV